MTVAHVTDDIVAEATPQRVGPVFIILFALAFFGIWLALMTPPTMSMALRVTDIDPANKATNLAMILGIGALGAMIANPLAGYFSDRTRSRFGKRKPWMFGGSIVAMLGLYVITIGNLPMIVLGWLIAQIGYNCVLAATTAILPDQVPVEQRGLLSGILGICTPLGILGGVALGRQAGGDVTNMFMWPAFISAALMLVFLFYFKDKTLDPSTVKTQTLGQFVRSFWVSPREAPDFTWAFISRFFLFIGLATLTTYKVFLLTDQLHIARPEVPSYMLTTMTIFTIAVVSASFISGWLSDMAKRRRIFVLGAAAIFAVGLVMIALSTTFTAFLWGVAVAGIAQGTYIAVDLALVTQVLPRPEDAAKDLGLFNIASALPQSIAPAIAPIFLAIGATGGTGNYSALFIAAGTFAAIGAVAVLMIKGVK